MGEMESIIRQEEGKQKNQIYSLNQQQIDLKNRRQTEEH